MMKERFALFEGYQTPGILSYAYCSSPSAACGESGTSRPRVY